MFHALSPRLCTMILVSLSFVLALSACASAGRPIDRTHLDEVAIGAQDKSQVRQWFGEPYAVQTGLSGHAKGCVERWKFEYAEAQGFGTVTYSEVLVIDFDTQGVVCDHAFSKSGEAR